MDGHSRFGRAFSRGIDYALVVAMKLNALLCVATLTVFVACGGGERPAQSPTQSGKDGATATEESCHKLAKLVCEGGGEQSSICQGIVTTVAVLPPSSCAEALKDPKFVTEKVGAQKESCRTLTTRLCKDMGERTAACAMARDQGEKFDAQRCKMMLEHYDEVLTDLRAFEKEQMPLGAEDQKAIAASDAPSFGPANAKVTVVLFSDFECPYCAKAAETVAHLKTHYADKVRFVFRQFPLSFHKRAKLAAEAALVAQASGKFWEYHDQLFANQEKLDLDALASYAKAVGLEPKSFREKVEGHVYENKIQADLDLGERVNVRGTPTLFINGKRSANATSTQAVVGDIEAALAE
jgi:protein-disulfide isomerase